MDISIAEGRQLGCLIAEKTWYPSCEPCKVEVYQVASERQTDDQERLVVEKLDIDGLKDITEPSLTGNWNNQDSVKICSVGLDVETDRTVDPVTGIEEPLLVSHQLYFAREGWRKALIFKSNLRFTESGFIEMLAVLAERDTRLALIDDLQMFVSAHFSLYECGWLIADNVHARRRRIIQQCLKQPGGMLAYIVASAYLKGLINKIFSESAATGSGLRVRPVEYTALEKAVAPVFGSESDLIDVNRLTEKQRFQLLKIGGGDNPGAALSSLYRTISRMELPMVKLDDGVELFMFDQTLTASPIRKQDRSWYGQIPLMSEETVARYEALAINALYAALEALSERFSLARVPAVMLGESEEKKSLRRHRRATWDADLRRLYF